MKHPNPNIKDMKAKLLEIKEEYLSEKQFRGMFQKEIDELMLRAYEAGDKENKEKLRALLEGLETNNIDKLLSEGKVGDFRNYGKAYIQAVRDKRKEDWNAALELAAEKVTAHVEMDDYGDSNIIVHADSILNLKKE